MKRTYTGSGTKIQQDLALLEETIFLVELDQLEGGTSAVSLLFGKLVPLIKTTFSVLLLDRHGELLRWEGGPKSMVLRSVTPFFGGEAK